jgi:hypothetical protein
MAVGTQRARSLPWSDRGALTALLVIYLVMGALFGLGARAPSAAYVTFADSLNAPSRAGISTSVVPMTPCA